MGNPLGRFSFFNLSGRMALTLPWRVYATGTPTRDASAQSGCVAPGHWLQQRSDSTFGHRPDLAVVSGDGQSGVADTQLAQPLIVKVTVNGLPRPLQVLNFRVVLGNGNVFGGTELTDLRGIAQELWTLGTKAGDPQKVEVRAVDPATGAPQLFATFTATARPGAATTLAVSGLQSPLTAGVSSPITVTAKTRSATPPPATGGQYTLVRQTRSPCCPLTTRS